MKCVIVVFKSSQYSEEIEDLDFVGTDIKAICDFDDRWEVFNKYAEKIYDKDELTDLVRYSDGLVTDEYTRKTYGLMLKETDLGE